MFLLFGSSDTNLDFELITNINEAQRRVTESLLLSPVTVTTTVTTTTTTTTTTITTTTTTADPFGQYPIYYSQQKRNF
ncbi:hypothetical protein FC063_23320 [Vibrio tasmaniensis]|uniref:Uncharacterized protein n=1 Tax=Vibrio tasmaniensis TaxID=212663 RepID=A0AB38NQS9_9VIBR|nr:hypothetical protein FC057_12175 [Vibrio tasmaniensis]TKG37181.1 hypothetical protein FC063_23320 [Vibrio tasmaniensis]TKG42369.1 hypothetical protein FC061_22700 [Vibrio tasmaniensis]TKG44534.1 hypothetical protein FC060_17150 [Vibrio tasmaniensis]TKG45441.1 hypothetical protein FC070_24270 [Vibrio tasmaniensis]